MAAVPIAFCITTLEPGGAERQLVDLITRLPRNEFEPYLIVLAKPPGRSQSDLLRKLEQARIQVDFLDASTTLSLPIVIKKLAGKLRRLQPKMLQCFLFHANVLGSVAARLVGVPVVLTGIRVAEARNNFHATLSCWTKGFVTRHVCVSESVAQFATEQLKLSAEGVLVIPNGVDVSRFETTEPPDRQQLGLPTSRKLLLFAGRLDPQKRPDWLLARMPEVFSHLPDHDLVLAGDGPLKEALQRQATELGIADRVHFLGWRSDLPQLLAAAEMLLLCSAWEGMPGVILEAMAAGKPVVTTNVHGVAEILGPLAQGQLVSAEAAVEFVSQIVYWAQHPEDAAAQGEANRQRVTAEFSLDTMAKRYANLYRELLN